MLGVGWRCTFPVGLHTMPSITAARDNGPPSHFYIIIYFPLPLSEEQFGARAILATRAPNDSVAGAAPRRDGYSNVLVCTPLFARISFFILVVQTGRAAKGCAGMLGARGRTTKYLGTHLLLCQCADLALKPERFWLAISRAAADPKNRHVSRPFA